VKSIKNLRKLAPIGFNLILIYSKKLSLYLMI